MEKKKKKSQKIIERFKEYLWVNDKLGLNFLYIKMLYKLVEMRQNLKIITNKSTILIFFEFKNFC